MGGTHKHCYTNNLSLIGATADVFTSSLSSVIAIGYGAVARTANTAVIWWDGANGRITHCYFGNGEQNASPLAVTLSGTNGVGTNINGANITIQWWLNSWSGTPWVINFATGVAGSSSATLSTATVRAELTPTYFRSLTGAAYALQHAAWSASLPTYTFSNDANTGIYSSIADNIECTTWWTKRLGIDANGNIRAWTLHNNATYLCITIFYHSIGII